MPKSLHSNEPAANERSLTLDPTDWDAFRKQAHVMLDGMIDFLEGVRERPVWQPVPQEKKPYFRQPVPREGVDLSEVYAQFQENILPYPNGNIHPRFWGWVMGTGTAEAMIADMMASGMNSNIAGFDQSAALVEIQVINWFLELYGFPMDATGVLVSGGTMANLTGLNVARYAKAGMDVRMEGNSDLPLTVYASTETHSWIKRACELMGLGQQAIRFIPTRDDFTIDTDALETTLEQDIKDGKKPFCIIGTVGTVNTGAVDDIVTLSRIAKKHDLWFHIDGAFGALAHLSPKFKDRVKGLDLADSLAFDLHKWFYLPYAVGCALIKHPALHYDTFDMTPSYLENTQRGIMPEKLTFSNLGLDLSRNFKALKVWMSIKTHGVDKFGQLIEQNMEQARYLTARIEREAVLELSAPTDLNIVCFRYVGNGVDADTLNVLNKELLLEIQEQRVAIPSNTEINGNYVMRVAITNHRSTFADFDYFIDQVVELGDRLAGN